MTVLTRQQQQQQQTPQQQQQQVANSLYATTGTVTIDNSNLMMRLHESIKQKEEFLKSPLPHLRQQQQQQQQLQQQQHFFPSHIAVASSSQLSTYSAAGGTTQRLSVTSPPTKGHVWTLVKSLPAAADATAMAVASGRESWPTNCDINYASATLVTAVAADGATHDMISMGRGQSLHRSNRITNISASIAALTTNNSRSASGNSNSNSSSTAGILRNKYQKDYEFLETLQETGVTNKV